MPEHVPTHRWSNIRHLWAQRWHVFFDGKPKLEGHVCGVCRAIGLGLDCPDAVPGGDCAHVQTRPCDCPEPKPACLRDT